ncbi:hypothetical protein MMC16_006229 [Acarospora aff. strigata]|nr:hypothetical protein [Acarospora aff. strigata]
MPAIPSATGIGSPSNSERFMTTQAKPSISDDWANLPGPESSMTRVDNQRLSLPPSLQCIDETTPVCRTALQTESQPLSVERIYPTAYASPEPSSPVRQDHESVRPDDDTHKTPKRRRSTSNEDEHDESIRAESNRTGQEGKNGGGGMHNQIAQGELPIRVGLSKFNAVKPLLKRRRVE